LLPSNRTEGTKHVSDREKHNHCTQKIVELVNELNAEGYDPQLLSAALMSASGIYSTFLSAGNTGGLQPSGVDKVVMMYRRSLEHIQERKKAENGTPAE
jgi:hypothetical protein